MADEPAKFILGDTAISSVEGPPRRRRRKAKAAAPTHCENCGAQLQGRWCAQCGQAAIDYRRSFRHVIVDVLDSFLNWDSKFFATIGWLIARPWYLTNEFLAGHRVRYFHPLRLYLLASILFFFSVNHWAKSINFDPTKLTSGELSPKDRVELETVLKNPDLPPFARAKIEGVLKPESTPSESNKREDTIHLNPSQTSPRELPAKEQAELETVLKNPNLPPAARAKIEKALERESGPMGPGKSEQGGKQNNPSPLPNDQKQETKKQGETNEGETKQSDTAQGDYGPIQFGAENPSTPFEKWLEAAAKEKIGEHGSRAQFFFMTLISNLPYMMLCCIPVFALILKILYIRRGVFYIDHLIYALHIHSFAYVGIVLIILFTIGLIRVAPDPLAGCIIAFLWVVFATQIFLSIRRVYRQGWFVSVSKFFAGGFVYLIVLFTGLIATVLATLKWS